MLFVVVRVAVGVINVVMVIRVAVVLLARPVVLFVVISS